jgi:hypothetical protein
MGFIYDPRGLLGVTIVRLGVAGVLHRGEGEGGPWRRVGHGADCRRQCQAVRGGGI